MNTSLLRHGFILILLSLIGGFFVSAMTVPRLGVAAHTIGILGGVLLIAIGAVWSHFALSSRQALAFKWCWLYSSYVNWFGCLFGAVFGSGRMTPVASGAHVGSNLVEAIVSFLLITVALTSLIGAGLALWGLRNRSGVASPPIE